MVNKAWKNFINESLTQLENANRNEPTTDMDSLNNNLEFDPNPPNSDKKTWCHTIDRSFGYAFKLFVRFVASRTLNEASIVKNYEISSEEFREMIDRNFRYREPETAALLPNYYKDYPRYARWHNWTVKNHKMFGNFYKCNMSYQRMLISARPKPGRRAAKETEIELGRYKVVKPVNKFKTPPLTAVFE